jgi:hypothetical protein
MDGPYDFDDAAAEALLRGAGHDVDAGLASLLGDLRLAYTSCQPIVSADLAPFIGSSTARAAAVTSPSLGRVRSAVAKIGVAAAAVVAATGGLAVAGAVPAPLRDALSHIGIGTSSAETKITGVGHFATTSVEPTTTTAPNHGSDVTGVAHLHTNEECQRGHRTAKVASHARANRQPCHNTATLPSSSTAGSKHKYDSNQPTSKEAANSHSSRGSNRSDQTPPATAAGQAHDHTTQSGGPTGSARKT